MFNITISDTISSADSVQLSAPVLYNQIQEVSMFVPAPIGLSVIIPNPISINIVIG